MAALTTMQQAWTWASTTLHPSHSDLIPRQQQGKRQGASNLQQHSRLQQQIPALPLQPIASQPESKEQFTQQSAQHKY